MKRIPTISFHFTSLIFVASLLAGEKPNILFIAIDDLKPTIGAYTNAVPTPAMDRIAARGTTFLNAHCQQAVCGPSRASVMTGKYPDFTQIWDLKTKLSITITIRVHTCGSSSRLKKPMDKKHSTVQCANSHTTIHRQGIEPRTFSV